MSGLSGKFITLEGGEGSGKTTLAKKLQDVLFKRGLEVELTREPGGTCFADKVRKLVVNKSDDDIDPLSETLLINAARRHHLLHRIIPKLRLGQWVICDRFIDSTLVYQGMVQGVPEKFIRGVHKDVCLDIYPDITFLLDVPANLGLSRTEQRVGSENEARFELKGIKFHDSVRQAFLKLASQSPSRVQVLDATQSEESVFKSALECLDRNL